MPLPHDNKALQWHYKTGHPSPDRLFRLAQTGQDVPQFPRDTLRNLFCVPCSFMMMRRAPDLKSSYELRHPLQLIYIGITGPLTPPIGNKTYSVSILDSFSANSDAYFIKRRSELANIIVHYKTSAELHTGYKLQSIRLDGVSYNVVTRDAYSNGFVEIVNRKRGSLVVEHCGLKTRRKTGVERDE